MKKEIEIIEYERVEKRRKVSLPVTPLYFITRGYEAIAIIPEMLEEYGLVGYYYYRVTEQMEVRGHFGSSKNPLDNFRNDSQAKIMVRILKDEAADKDTGYTEVDREEFLDYVDSFRWQFENRVEGLI